MSELMKIVMRTSQQLECTGASSPRCSLEGNQGTSSAEVPEKGERGSWRRETLSPFPPLFCLLLLPPSLVPRLIPGLQVPTLRCWMCPETASVGNPECLCGCGLLKDA